MVDNDHVKKSNRQINVHYLPRQSSEVEDKIINNDKYDLKICIDLPGKDARETALLPVKDNWDAGHAFVTLIRKDITDTILNIESFGLYPAVNEGYMLGKSVPGKIIDDTSRHRDAEYTYSISDQAYYGAIAFAYSNKATPPEYNLFSHNCIDFVCEVAKKAGIYLPSNLAPTMFKQAMDRGR